MILLVGREGDHLGDGFLHDTATRFMGLIVIAVGTQFAMTGLRDFFVVHATLLGGKRTSRAARWQISEHRGDRALAHKRAAALAPSEFFSPRCGMRVARLDPSSSSRQR